MTVLIVEDNAGVRRLLGNAVAGLAADVWECSDGADALAAYAAHQPDVFLMMSECHGRGGRDETDSALVSFGPSDNGD
jgi:CheY-like chemotaxis protein